MKKKSSIDKYIYELNGQISMFGHDNLSFKTINMPKKQRFNNICINFKLKKLIKEINLFLPIIYIDS
tara:strand:- start:827 stop:1027 length:201 start_codon:yes stop_codon:yes gene_type:complete